MKQINQLTAQPLQNMQQLDNEQIKQTAKSIEYYTARVDRLFKRLKAVCPAWKANMPTEDQEKANKALWTRLIVERGLTDEELKHGIEKAEGMNIKWWVNPNEFIEWCLESPLTQNIPTLDESYQECRKNAYTPLQSQWTHVLAYWSGYGMWHNLKETTKDKPNAQFENQYKKALAQLKAGTLPPLPEHKQVLEDRSDKAVTSEEKEQLKQIGKETLKKLLNK